ncbi:MAG: hypothetical protein JWM46_231 [Candidatus Kaiserbacteria bacterium]|nr:hypothetical protein [Candidatus Kaiserbacteria bacterium]
MFKDLQAYYAARHEPESMRPLAEVYWRMLLMIGFLMVFGVLAYGTGEFFGVINNLSSADGSSATHAATLDRNSLQNTLEVLDARRARFDAAPSAAVSDPSR